MKDRRFVVFAGLFVLFSARMYSLRGQDAAAPAKQEPKAPALPEIPVSRLNANARAAQGEAQLRYKLGLGGGGGRGDIGIQRTERRETLRRPELPKELKQVLAKEVSVNYDDGKPLREIIEKLKEL